MASCPGAASGMPGGSAARVPWLIRVDPLGSLEMVKNGEESSLDDLQGRPLEAPWRWVIRSVIRHDDGF